MGEQLDEADRPAPLALLPDPILPNRPKDHLEDLFSDEDALMECNALSPERGLFGMMGIEAKWKGESMCIYVVYFEISFSLLFQLFFTAFRFRFRFGLFVYDERRRKYKKNAFSCSYSVIDYMERRKMNQGRKDCRTSYLFCCPIRIVLNIHFCKRKAFGVIE